MPEAKNEIAGNDGQGPIPFSGQPVHQKADENQDLDDSLINDIGEFDEPIKKWFQGLEASALFSPRKDFHRLSLLAGFE